MVNGRVIYVQANTNITSNMTLVYANIGQTKYIITDTSGTYTGAFYLGSATTYKLTYYTSNCPYNLNYVAYPLWYCETQSTNFIQCSTDASVIAVYSQPNISPQLSFGIFVVLNLADNKKLTMIDVGGHMATSSINLYSSNGTPFNSSGTI